MAHNNGKISKPVQFNDIKLTLGTSANDIGQLCTSTLINRWSKNKPVRYDSPAELTAAQRKFTNYGFDMNYSEDIYIPNLYTKVVDNPEWVYLQPQNGNWHRTLDFNGYNHNAVPPFSYDSFPEVINTVVDTASIQFRILKNSLAEIDMDDLAYFDGKQSSFRYAIALRKSGATDVYLYYGDTIADAGSEILIDVEFNSTGYWDVLFIATRETSLLPQNIGSVYMPLGYKRVQVKKVTAYAQTKLTSTYNLRFSSDGVISGFHPVNLTVKAVSTALTETTARFILNVICYDSAGRSIGSFVVDSDTGDFTYKGTAQQTYSLDFLLGASIAINAYAPGISVDDVSKVEITADLKTVTGLGVMIFDKEYKWELTKQIG